MRHQKQDRNSNDCGYACVAMILRSDAEAIKRKLAVDEFGSTGPMLLKAFKKTHSHKTKILMNKNFADVAMEMRKNEKFKGDFYALLREYYTEEQQEARGCGYHWIAVHIKKDSIEYHDPLRKKGQKVLRRPMSSCIFLFPKNKAA